MTKVAKKGKIAILKEICKGCGLCVDVCSQGILGLGDEMNSKGYYFSRINSEKNCTGCAVCAEMCPDLAIEVWRKSNISGNSRK
ncbi:MAG: 4Fe-4S binding protein [Deltaproteobacteria bacterium]|nr:MAG: 4Fe-4S binding protein [Deltaproteobacteria bacterium]